MAKNRNVGQFLAMIIYPESIPEDFKDRLRGTGWPIAISPIHDSDPADISATGFLNLSDEDQNKFQAGTLFKKAHYHVLMDLGKRANRETIRSKIKKVLGEKSVSQLKIIDSIEAYYAYLTHDTQKAAKAGKARYKPSDITLLNKFNISKYSSLSKSDRQEIYIQMVKLIHDKHLINLGRLIDYVQEHESTGINFRDCAVVMRTDGAILSKLCDSEYYDWSRNFIKSEAESES